MALPSLFYFLSVFDIKKLDLYCTKHEKPVINPAAPGDGRRGEGPVGTKRLFCSADTNSWGKMPKSAQNLSWCHVGFDSVVFPTLIFSMFFILKK